MSGWCLTQAGDGKEGNFSGTDAVAEDYEAKDVSIVEGREVRVWTKLEPAGETQGAESTLSGSPTKPYLSALVLGWFYGAWGHEHCELCHEHIDAGMFGYCDPGEHVGCARSAMSDM